MSLQSYGRKNALFRTIITAVVVWMLLLTFSCNYQSDETYYKEIPEPDLSNLFLDLSNTTNDTLYLFGITKLSINAFLGGRETYGAYIFVDDMLVERVTSASEFTIDASLFPNGRHILRLELYARAGTGSLGDIAGAEQLVLKREWVTYLDHTAPDATEFTFVGIANNKMKIEWKRYPKFNFTAYVLEKQYWNASYNSYSTCWKKELANKNVLSFTDSTYLGGKVRYRISIKAGETFSPSTTKDFNYTNNPSIAFSWIDKENVKVTWRKPRITHSFKDYEISLSFQPAKKITVVTDTTIILQPNIAFGQIASISFTVHNNGNNCEGGRTVYSHIYRGTEFATFGDEQISWCPAINKYFARTYASGNYDSLSRIDATTKKIEQSILIDGSFAISPNGKYLYVSYDNVLRQYDPLTFAVIKTYNLFELDNTYASMAGRFQVTDSNLLSFVTYNGNYVVKMPEFEVVYRGVKDYTLGISSSGNSLVSNGQLWKWNASQYTAVQPLAGTFTPIFKDDNTLIKIYYRSKISIQDLTTFVERSAVIPENTDVITYDPISDMIGYAEESYTSYTLTSFHLIDMQGNHVKTFSVAQLDNHRSEHIFLINNQILCSRGYTIPLSYYYP